jgi:molybdate transport system ATP-binding protein
MLELSVSKKFNKNPQLFSYNIVSDAKRMVLFGPSGSGKTSLLKMIAGFYNPDYGTIKFNNKIFFSKKNKTPIYKRKIGYIPQEYTLFPHMSVKENILYGVKINKLHFDKAKFSYLLKKLNLQNKMNFFPNELSGGEKQRVALARALMVNPDILLLDEPFSALDKPMRDSLKEMVIELLDFSDTKAIFVTHDSEDAYDFGHEIYIVFKGQIIEHGSRDKVFQKPDFMETAQLLNFKNIWTKKDFFSAFPSFNLYESNSDFLSIKPEYIDISKKSSGFKNNFTAKIVKIKKLHSFDEIISAAGGITITSIFPKEKTEKMELKNNDFVNLCFSQENIIPLKKYFGNSQ